MKKAILLLTSLLLLTISCHKDRVLTWPGNVEEIMEGMTYGAPPAATRLEVSLAGEMTLTPDFAYGYCLLPERSAIPLFNRLALAGELEHFGAIDARRSYQEHDQCTLVPEADMVTAMAMGTLVNQEGDVIYYYGDAICHEDGRYDGKFYISGGAGAFADVTGWISLEMVLSRQARDWPAEVAGEILVSTPRAGL